MLRNEIPAYFQERRDALMKANPESAFIFPANPEIVRNNDVHYAHRQDSSFYYLTALEEPNSIALLVPSGSQASRRPGYRFILFISPKDPEHEMWEGERYGVEGAISVLGADEAYPIDEFDLRAPQFLKSVDQVFYRLGMPNHEATDRRVLAVMERVRKSLGRSGKALARIADPNEKVGEMRLFKRPEEVALMRQSGAITAEAHRRVMAEVRPGMNERDVEALVDYYFKRGGCARNGYGSIVAGGKNAACLHYRSNNEVLREGELLLIDAGGEYEYYSADITRTFPVGRVFTEAQGKVYDWVLKSQVEAVAMAKPGAKLPDIHAHVCRVLIEGFLSLGLLEGTPEEVLKTGRFRRFYPHNTSHFLGMDVHDSGLYLKNGEPRVLEPGMVITIEPGFYVQPRDLEAPAAYRNIGIRIEDDILITAAGNENLTHGVPKTREEIEKLRAY
jgi:Xaa-Pro aminopeptidase